MTTVRKPTEPSRLEQLQRILRLERERGYTNRTVLGGLDKFLAQWRTEMQASADQQTLKMLADIVTAAYQEAQGDGPKKRGYARLTPAQRDVWTRSILEALEARISTQRPSEPAPDAAPEQRERPQKTTPPGLSLDSPATIVQGVGTGIAGKLKALGVITVRDLLYHFPRRHIPLMHVRDLAPGQEQAMVGTAWEIRTLRMGVARRETTEAVVGDETGNLRVLWFNQPFVTRSVQANDQIMVTGHVRTFRGQRTLEATAYEVMTSADELFQPGRLVPIYPSTEGLTQRALRRVVRNALEVWLPRMSDFLPEELCQRLRLTPLPQAIHSYHYPLDQDAWSEARHRLAFDELFLIQLDLLSRKEQWQRQAPGFTVRRDQGVLQSFLDSLPFTLTQAQQRALEEILSDMASGFPMARLLQGDVGSGKTVVVLAAMLMAAAQGYQTAIMAPTEILAEQHFLTFSRLLEGLSRPVKQSNLLALYLDLSPRPLGIGLLLGSLRRREKEEVRQRIETHALDIVVGTHALIQGEVAFPHLALAVVDEEHRFGVVQRRLLGKKGQRPHMLSMSATPIPRSLALTLYGDLDVSTIDELPAGRRPVRTRWLRPDQRDAAYGFLRRQTEEGRQAFVVCPLIQESEALQTRAALEEHRRLSEELFPDLRVGLLHGQMPLAEKAVAMERFRSGEVHILVSTPVIEVGVDIPNASVIFIEGADRFGLSELHQFRGRVGRGEHSSYCLLLADDPSPEAQERLSIMERESDGFRVAEEDLRLRGPGQLLGTRQSGLPDLKVATLADLELLGQARQEAARLLQEDPDLAQQEHAGLGAALASRVVVEVAEES